MSKRIVPSKRKQEQSDDLPPKRQKKIQKGAQLTLVDAARSTTVMEWTSTVHNVEDVTQEHVLAAYGIGPLGIKRPCFNKYKGAPHEGSEPRQEDDNMEIIEISDDEETHLEVNCSKAKCKTNPYCLNYLGQDMWENPDKGKKIVQSSILAKFGGDPHLRLRKDGKPVGLRNLGATCYANAFLQVWNQHRVFRSGVFQCIPSADTEESLVKSPIFQLQVTFAALCYGKGSVFNPRPLVDSLRLSNTEQQDAQEFAKLFLSHLDNEFKKQNSPTLKTLVTDQFEGTSAYGTKCHACGYKSERETPFTELEISLKNHLKLEDALTESLQAEVLSGDNKYQCPTCNSLQDATRYTLIRKLPPVLHFSVQRFIFDFENMTRKKSKADVQFPSVIDMGPWIGEGDEGSRQHDISSEQNVYELRGVLLHKGASAYHGHYEAQVYSSDEHKWYQFNDEIVTETDLQPKGSNKKQASSTCTDAAQNGARAFNSRDCYCLIYARRNSEHACFQLEMPSRDVQARIDALNEDLQGRCDDYNTTLKQQLAEFESLRMEKQRIYNTWQISNIQEPFRIISLRALQLWLQRGFPENISDKTKDDRSALGQEWNREVPLIQCLHGRVDPSFAADIRVVKVASFNALMVSHADLFAQEGMWELCIDCTQLLLRERIYSQDHMKDVEEFRVVEEEDNECVMITDEAFWISKNWLRDWTLSKPKMHIPGLPDPGPEKEPFQSHVYCEHGNLTLSEGSRVRIGPKSLSFIQGLFPEWEPPLTSSESCVLCESYAASDSVMKEEAVAVSVKERESLRILKSMNPLTNGKIVLTGVTYALIPTNWVRSWMSWIGEPRRHSRPADVDNSIFLCSHDLLALDPCDATSLMNTDLSLVTLMQWEKIVAHYPGSGPLITLKRVQDEGLVCEGRGSCRECLLTSDSNKSEDCDVFIHILEKSDDTPTLESHNQVRIAMAANPSMLPSPSTRVMSRRSKRLRGEKGFLRLTCVSATRKSSILLLLCQTSLQEGVRLQDQTFYYEGKEITDESTTLEELSFSSGDLLQLVIERGARSNAMVIELESDDDTLGETSKRRKVPPAEGRAFQGTLLASA